MGYKLFVARLVDSIFNIVSFVDFLKFIPLR